MGALPKCAACGVVTSITSLWHNKLQVNEKGEVVTKKCTARRSVVVNELTGESYPEVNQRDWVMFHSWRRIRRRDHLGPGR